MIYPKCGSENVLIQREQTTTVGATKVVGQKKKGCLSELRTYMES